MHLPDQRSELRGIVMIVKLKEAKITWGGSYACFVSGADGGRAEVLHHARTASPARSGAVRWECKRRVLKHSALRRQVAYGSYL